MYRIPFFFIVQRNCERHSVKLASQLYAKFCYIKTTNTKAFKSKNLPHINLNKSANSFTAMWRKVCMGLEAHFRYGIHIHVPAHLSAKTIRPLCSRRRKHAGVQARKTKISPSPKSCDCPSAISNDARNNLTEKKLVGVNNRFLFAHSLLAHKTQIERCHYASSVLV